ncbi:MAG: (d)CMP kinase [Actinobacteria bacterium]|nr:(d)CMP kinase [Actinomycetota bacterium]
MKVVAIDGPAGAGKSTVARLVAERLGIPFLDTGAMFRAVAVTAASRGVDPEDGSAVALIARSIDIDVDGDRTTVDGTDVSAAIRTQETNRIVSIVARHAGVRDVLRARQRDWMSARGAGVVEGRDISTVVFPDACLKIFLTASADERAVRRVAQSGGSVADVAAQIRERDHLDSTRQIAPLAVAADAVVIDSTGRTVDEVVAEIADRFGGHCGGR